VTTQEKDINDTLPWQDGNPKLMGTKDGTILFGHVFETDQGQAAFDFAGAINGQLYTWEASGTWNQLVRGWHLADRFLYVVLPPASILRDPDGTWPELIDLADDECEEDDDECGDEEEAE
jgi:hypothetical protein